MLFALDVLCLWAMVSIKRLFQLSPLHPPLTRFSPGFFVVIQAILYQYFAMIKLLQKVIHFQSRLIFSSQLIAGWFWFCSFVYMFIRTLSQSSVIIKLLIALHLHVCIASYWVSHQIMWYKKIIYDHGLKIIRSWCFFGFVGSYVWGWYHLHNFNPKRLGGAGWVQSTPLLIYLSSHEKHFYTGPDAPGLLIKFIWARINHAAETF